MFFTRTSRRVFSQRSVSPDCAPLARIISVWIAIPTCCSHQTKPCAAPATETAQNVSDCGYCGFCRHCQYILRVRKSEGNRFIHNFFHLHKVTQKYRERECICACACMRGCACVFVCACTYVRRFVKKNCADNCVSVGLRVCMCLGVYVCMYV